MYNKLFTKILDSSIWLESHTTRIVFITLLAAMDEDGYAHFSAIENLASRSRVTVTQCNAAIKTLSEPDPNSCDPEHDGRRIERVPGGFMILNAKKYREIGNNVSRRESTRLRVQRFREKQIVKEQPKSGNADVTLEALHPEYAHAHEYASEYDSEKGESRGEMLEAVIPTVDEIFKRVEIGLGIPRDYCAHYHQQCTVKNRWLRSGRLIQWHLEIPVWWAKDRGTWGNRNGETPHQQPQKSTLKPKVL